MEVQLAQPGAEPRVKARALGSTTIEVRLKNGRSLMVAAGFDGHHLRALLAVASAAGSGCTGLNSNDIIDNALSSKPQVVQIDPSDTAFQTDSWQPWHKTDR